ncbi:MAG: hypothetical protein WCF57_07295 [Pyrinomonadaceae bacterium]
MAHWFRRIFGKSSDATLVSTDTSPGGVYSHLRQQALSLRRADSGISDPPPDAPAWGALMESGYADATVTLFALIDGTTSLYISSGGGVIGGQGHQSVREANADFIRTANQFYQHLKPCQSFPIPATGQTIFYVLTDSGILTGEGPDDDLGNGRHPLSPLFHAGHAVLTPLIQTSENAGADA